MVAAGNVTTTWSSETILDPVVRGLEKRREQEEGTVRLAWLWTMMGAG